MRPVLTNSVLSCGMTADAVVHDDLGAGVFCHDGLMLGVGDKVADVLHAVHALEEA
jgi:hypothetical protein